MDLRCGWGDHPWKCGLVGTTRDALEGGRYPPPPLQGAQPLPSHCPPDAKCQLQQPL